MEERRRWWRETGERELRCILMTAWDPVGAGDAPEAWDEYDSYVAGVGWCLQEANDPDRAAELVAGYLDHVERDVAWHEWSFLRGGRPPQEWINDD